MNNLYESWKRGDNRVSLVYDGEIGKGGSGEVYRVCLSANGQHQNFSNTSQVPPATFGPGPFGPQNQNPVQQVFKFARKHTRPFGTWFTEESVREELLATEFLGRGRNPYLVEILGSGQFPAPYSRDFYIDMELCGNSLEQYLRDLDAPAHHQFLRREIWLVMHQISSGVEFIHNCNTVHRDLKPPNILYSTRDGVWKVADFGTAARGSFQDSGTVLGRGTTSYRAPEVSGGSFSIYSDVWGLGCILWKLLTRSDCFPDDLSLAIFVQGYQHRFPQWRPVSFPLQGRFGQNVMQWQRNLDAMLAVEPRQRPDARSLKQVFHSILNS